MDVKLLELRTLIESLEKIEGRGTQLISYYIPAGYDIAKVLEHLNYEYSTSQNIKDKHTRKNVGDALAKIINYLKGLKKLPENGLVIFCGNIGDYGESDIKLWAIEPPEPLQIRLYRCDSKFVLDPLKEYLEPKQVYGLVVLDRGEATIGLLKGNRIIVLENKDSWVPGKFRDGGQSALRFQRIIEQEVHEWLKYIGEKIKEHFDKYKDKLVGFLIGGPGPLKEKFVQGEYMPYYFKDKILAVVDTGYSNEYGLKEMVEKAKEVLEKTEYIKEINIVKEFFTRLSKGLNTVVYGEEDVKKAIEFGAVEKILISEKFKDKISEYLELAKKINAEIELISLDHPEGEQFSNFGIAALLRFPIY
ncbi:MAG: peptide chain release factor aRF-1 [Nanopusillaceae archaeon]